MNVLIVEVVFIKHIKRQCQIYFLNEGLRLNNLIIMNTFLLVIKEAGGGVRIDKKFLIS